MRTQHTTLKEQILATCETILREKESELLAELAGIAEARDIETKSTAGDKHETARAHMQIRQEQLSLQLSLLKQQIVDLGKINVLQAQPRRVSSGSLVLTNRGFFFIAVAVGKITVDAQEVFVVSPRSPVGRTLSGLEAGAEFSLNGTAYLVLEIW